MFSLWWTFVAAHGLSPVVVRGALPYSSGAQAAHCPGLSWRRARVPSAWASVLAAQGVRGVAHGSSCSAACGVFPDQGSNPRPLQGGFLTTGPPSKPKERFIKRYRPLKNCWDGRQKQVARIPWVDLFHHITSGTGLTKSGNSESETCSLPADPGQDRAMMYSSRFHALSSPLSLHNSFPEQNFVWRRLKICIIIIMVKLYMYVLQCGKLVKCKETFKNNWRKHK